MSKALLRRNSSKEGLQNLIRLTAQRSAEDAEEAQRQRRRRARERPCGGDPHPEPADRQHAWDEAVKAGGSPSPEEDEGFGDWTQRRREADGPGRERGRGRGRGEPGPEDASPSRSSRAGVRREDGDEHGGPRPEATTLGGPAQEEDNKRQQAQDAEAVRQEATTRPGDQARSRSSRCGQRDEAERRLEKIRQGLQEKESQELERAKRGHARAEHEPEEPSGKREARRRLRSDQEEGRLQGARRQRAALEEEERGRTRDELARRRTEALSDGSRKTPAHKISERTESLSRSLKKSNSFKKTAAPVLVSSIDDKMEQYAHAVENSQEARGSKSLAANLPGSLEAVTSKKNLFESGEARSSGPPKPTSCRDTDSLKVGVANLITQWVKGQPDGGRPPQSRAADVKCGDVMQKKNMWEGLGDSAGRSASNIKGSAAHKFKFVVTGHGKYQKISVDQERATNGKSDLCQNDY